MTKYGYNLFSIAVAVVTAIIMAVGAWVAVTLSSITPPHAQSLLYLFVILPALGAFKFLLREPPVYKKEART